jgi:hypothetical protein
MQRSALSSFAVIMKALEESRILADINTSEYPSSLPLEDKNSNYAKTLNLLRHYNLIDSGEKLYLMPDEQEQLKISLLVLPDLCQMLALVFDDAYRVIRIDPRNNAHFRKMVMQVICQHLPCFDKGGRVGMFGVEHRNIYSESDRTYRNYNLGNK